jgi:membrane fusion protein
MRLRSTTPHGPSLVAAPTGVESEPRRRSLSRALYLAALAVAALLGLRVLLAGALHATATGVVDRGETAVGVERSGRTEAVLVDVGQVVRKGEALAEVSVLEERTAAERARREAERLRADATAEVERAATRAREQAGDGLAEAARLRDDALRPRAEAEQAGREIAALRRQVAELDEELAAREELRRQEIVARSALVDLKVRRHELEGKREGLLRRRAVLEENVAQLLSAAERLDERVAEAPIESVKASQLAFLEARAAQLEAEARQHDRLAHQPVVAPVDGRVAWLEARPGEVVQPGRPLVRIVPDGTPAVIAWPGKALGSFPVGARVQVRGEGFTATGTVERTLLEDRAKPDSLLRPYQRAAVEAAVLVRLDETASASVRAGSVVEVRRPRLRLLERWIAPPPPPEPEHLARR